MFTAKLLYLKGSFFTTKPHTQTMTNCTNCSYEVALKYCPNCGQPASVKRIDAHYITHEIEHVLHFERGIFYTIRGLLIRPGENVREFISLNRSRLVKPIIFIIITSLIYTVIIHFFHIKDEYVNFTADSKTNTIGLIFAWIQNHYGYSNIMIGVFIALWAKLFYRKYNYNFFEILILLCFVMGIGMLILAVFALLQGITHIKLMPLGSLINIFYSSWAVSQFFDKKKASNYLKAFGANMLGFISFAIAAVLVGVAVELIITH